MATITINLNDEINEKFREAIRQKVGEGKGKNEKAPEEAIISWIKEKKQDDIANEMLEIMETGLKMGKIKIKAREELHER